MKTSAKHTARCGELLCQFRLLQHGIESERDKVTSLLAQSKTRTKPFTIQIKTCNDAKRGGGTGRLALDWWIPDDCTSDYVALVDVQGIRVWLFTLAELTELAQQKPEGRMHFFMYTDPEAPIRKDGKLQHEYEFRRHLIENAIHRLGIMKKSNKSEMATPRKPSD